VQELKLNQSLKLLLVEIVTMADTIITLGEFTLSEFAEYIVCSQSFNFDSFEDARLTLIAVIDEKKHIYEYDRLSLCKYSHDFSQHDYRILGKLLEKWRENVDKESIKTREEYAALFHYAKLASTYQHCKIIKTARPDFTLEIDNKRVGIEVTRLIAEEYTVLHKIAKEREQAIESADLLKRIAIGEHGEKAKKYNYYQLKHGVAVGLALVDVNERKAVYAKKIDHKISLYIDKLEAFDDFLILCDADGIEITSNFDAQDVLSQVLDISGTRPITVLILYVDTLGELSCESKTFFPH